MTQEVDGVIVNQQLRECLESFHGTLVARLEAAAKEATHLRERNNALRLALRAMEGSSSLMRDEIEQLRARANPELLASERKANAMLTEALEKAELDAAKWRVMIANTEPEKAAQLDAAITLLLSIQGEPK